MPSDKSIAAGLAVIETDKSKVLGLRIGKHNVEPGLLIPKAEAQEEPELSFAGAESAAIYMVVCLDLDAPFTSFSFMSPILHWIQPGLKVQGDRFEATEPFIVDYAGPGPPPGSGPHRYCFFLYEQPEGFDVKAHAPSGGAKVGIWPRVRYSLEDWEEKAKLGEVIAANYFTSN